MRPPKNDAPDVLGLSAGYELRLTWDETRKSLNQSPLYQALRRSNGLFLPAFVENAGAIAKYSRRLEAALELSTLAREVAAGKPTTPVELYGRAAKFLGLRTQTLDDAPPEPLADGGSDGLSPQGSEHAPAQNQSGPGSAAETIEVGGSALPNVPSPRELFDIAFKLLQGSLSSDERVELFEGVRREALESSKRIELLNSELQRLLKSNTPFVRHRPLYECRCGPLGHDISAACAICGSIPSEHPRSISSIQPELDRIIEANIWLELAVAKVFDEHGFVTYVGSHPVGLSGASHEVDVLAWDPQLRHLLLAEVSTKQASMERLGRVVLRRDDIPAHACVLVTLGEAAEGAVEYGRRHSIGIIPRIRENADQLSKWIESTRRGLGTFPRSTIAGEGRA